MNETFSKTLVACAAIATAVGGGAAIVNGASSLIDTRVQAVLLLKEQQQGILESLAESASTLVKGPRK
jgi:hypothetical protein